MPKPVKPKLETVAPVERDADYQYPEVSVVVCTGDQAMTVENAKDYLGYEEETDDVKFGPDFLITAPNGRKVRTKNNTKNRPIDERWTTTLAYEHLRKKWRVNGETIVIGKTGEVISGQHRLLSLIFAEQLRETDPETWGETEVTMECVVVVGVDEADDTVNTLDTGKARTLSDVLYRCELFSPLKPKDRQKVAGASDYAIRLLWERTGAKEDAYAPTRTHSESMDFLYRHKKLVDCVRHLVEEESDGSISTYLRIGTASGLCYLMAACETDPTKYKKNPCEEVVNLKHMDKAQEFFVALAGGANDVKALRDAIREKSDPDTGLIIASLGERISFFVKAWNQFLTAGKVTPAQIKLQYRQEDDLLVLDERPTVGGIDLELKESVEPTDEEKENDDPTPEQIEQTKAAIKGENEVKKKDAKVDPAATEKVQAELTALRKKYPGCVLWFESKDSYNFFGSDVDALEKCVGVKGSQRDADGMKKHAVKKNQHVPMLRAFNEAGLQVVVVSGKDGETISKKLDPIAKKINKK